MFGNPLVAGAISRAAMLERKMFSGDLKRQCA